MKKMSLLKKIRRNITNGHNGMHVFLDILCEFFILILGCEEPCGRDRRASEIEYLFSVSFPLVGNPSDLFGIARKILDKPE